ncbi:MAG: TOBE domain-containing protein, partial [Erysipelotrichaceae bacterium]|nr:TOBE domain-containing protein [Erysipelotrichaceae bacterium]
PMDIIVGARPEHITLKEVEGAMMEGSVDVSEMMGSSVHIHLNTGNHDSIIIVPTLDLGNQPLSIGSKVRFTFAPNVVHMFDKETGKNLEY